MKKKAAIIRMIILTLFIISIELTVHAKANSVTTSPDKNDVNIFGNYPANINTYRSVFSIQGDWMYYGDEKGLFKIKADKSNVVKLSTDSANNINVVGDWVYYTRNKPFDSYYKLELEKFDINETYEDVYELIKIKTDGTSKIILDKGDTVNYDSNVRKCYVRGNRIYYSNAGGTVFRMDTNGKNKKKTIEHSNGGIYFHKNTIFYNDDQGYLYRINKDGTNNKKISNEVMWLVGISKDHIYYRKFANDSIGTTFLYKMNSLDFKKSLVVKGTIGQVIVSDKYIYYIYEATNTKSLYRMKTENTSKTLIHNFHSNMSYPINIWGEYIYFIDSKSKSSQEPKLFKIANSSTKIEEVILN